MKEWYAAKELMGLPGMPGTERGIQKRAHSEQWHCQDVPAKGGPGGKRREYHFSSLPEATRMHLLAPEPAAVPSTPSDLAAFLDSQRINISPEQLADPTWQKRISCFRVFNTCPAYSGREALLDRLAAQYDVSKLTVRNWIRSVETLQTKRTPRIKVGEEPIEIPRSSAFSPEALAFGLGRYANDAKAGMKTAYNDMARFASERGWQLGDYSNFTRIVKRLPPAIITRIRKGALGFELSCVPKIIKEWTAVPVQSVLCGDQKIFDYYVVEPETGEIIVPEGYFFMDCSSRMINGISVELGHYNSHTVGCSLREALRYGISDEIFTDWGKPEGSKHITQMLQGLSGYVQTDTFLAMAQKYEDMDRSHTSSRNGTAINDEPVSHRKAQPCKPWQKPIENIMNLVEQRLREKHLPGYRKRAHDAWENKEVQATLKRQAKAGELLTVQDFLSTLLTTVEEHNKAEKRLKEGKTIIPATFFEQGLRSQSRPTLPDYTLDYICLPRVDRRPMQGTITVTVRGEERRYVSPELSALSVATKEKVWLSYDPYDYTVPAVLTDMQGNYIGLAEPWPLHHPNDTDGLAVKRAYQQEIMTWFREQAKRLREGFGVIETAIPRVTTATHTAKKAEKARHTHDLNKENARLIEAERNKEAEVERLRLVAKWEEDQISQDIVSIDQAPSARPALFVVPSDGKDKYRLWLSIDARIEAGNTVPPEEAQFHELYQRSGDYRINKMMHEKFGELHIGVTPAATSAGMTE